MLFLSCRFLFLCLNQSGLGIDDSLSAVKPQAESDFQETGTIQGSWWYLGSLDRRQCHLRSSHSKSVLKFVTLQMLKCTLKGPATENLYWMLVIQDGPSTKLFNAQVK